MLRMGSSPSPKPTKPSKPPKTLKNSLVALSLFASSTSDASADITLPANIISGDLILLVDYAHGTSTKVIPSLYNEIITSFVDVTFDSRVTCSYKISTGSDSSAVVTGQNGSTDNSKIALVFRAASAISAVNFGTPNQEGTGGNPALQTVLAGAESAPLIVIGVYAAPDVASIATRTFSTTADGEVNELVGDDALYVKYKLYDASPANTDVDMDDNGAANILQSFFLELTASTAVTAQMTVGAFTLSGQTTNSKFSSPMPRGEFTFTGQTIQGFIGKVGVVLTGAFTLTGQTISPTKIMHAALDAGAFVLSGVSTNLARAYRKTMATGEFILRGGWHSPRPDSTATSTNRRVNRKWWASLLNGRN